MNASEKRAELDLHINLLAEHEITKILQPVSKLVERVGIGDGNSSEMAELKRDVAPEKILAKIEQRSLHIPMKEVTPTTSEKKSPAA
jgi:uncharacterized membrane protein